MVRELMVIKARRGEGEEMGVMAREENQLLGSRSSPSQIGRLEPR